MTLGPFDPRYSPPTYKPRIRRSAEQRYSELQYCCYQTAGAMGFGKTPALPSDAWCFAVFREHKELRELQRSLEVLKK